jgi:hypothetical protein
MYTPCVTRYIERLKVTHRKWTDACILHARSKTEANRRACEDARVEHMFNECAAWWMDMHESNVQPHRLYYEHPELFSQETFERMHDYAFKIRSNQDAEFLDAYASFYADPTSENALHCAKFPVSKESFTFGSMLLREGVAAFAEHLRKCAE